MSSSPWFWRFNPRFYRGTRPNNLTKYLYWIFGYEILATALLGLFIWWTVIPMAKLTVERRNREIERGRRERLGLPTEAASTPESSTKNASSPSSRFDSDFSSDFSFPRNPAPMAGAGATPKEIK